ncbi:MAG: MarR family winged helix-turn-helix transcriptional regulator [Solirubrobacteraceae bacterium]
MQATTEIGTAVPARCSAQDRRLAADLYALTVYLHKDATADLFEAIGALELTITQTKLLGKLEHSESELTLKHAAELLGLSLPAVSRAVDDMVRRGLLTRHEDAADRRMKRVSLTEAGQTMIYRVNAARLDGLQQFAATLSDAERRALVAALRELLRRPEVACCRPQREARA